jgi:chemotaxis protein methyltransferase CheR
MLDTVHEIEDLEIDLLLEAIHQRSGLDFRGYLREPLRNKLHGFMQANGLETVSAVQERMLHDPASGERLLRTLGKQPPALFDDAKHFLALRGVIGAWLRSRPAPRVWIAECVAAEEVFAMAILLHEEELYDRTQIFATCSNEALLGEAAQGRISAAKLDNYEHNYRAGGGKQSLREHLCEKDGQPAFVPHLGANITWAQYNLATDASFNEFEFIMCRNALGEFGPALKRRSLKLFHDSLAHFGILSADGLDNPESDPSIAGYTSIQRAGEPCSGLFRRVA